MRPLKVGLLLAIVVPSFVSTFATPIPALTSSSARSLSSVSLAAPISLNAALVPSAIPGVVVDQPFVVGPGFSPIPAKLVSQIVSGKYVDLSELLAAYLVRSDPEHAAATRLLDRSDLL